MLATEPMETIHLYYESEEPQVPRSGNDVWVVLFALACFVLILWKVCSLPPSLETVTVSVHFLPLQRFSVAEKIIPTGVKIYPATSATGTLTIYNGSFLSERIPQGLILTTSNGVAIVTDESVAVPAGNPPNYGMAAVSAHALVSGTRGNIPADAMNQIYGSSLYVRNLAAFSGGKQGYSITYTTPQDRDTALEMARAILSSLVPQKMLDAPCSESVKSSLVTWVCQYITFTPPVFFRVVGVQVRGKQVIVYGFPVMRPYSNARR